MSGRGRPLRFLALVVSGWAGARVIMLWPAGASLPEAIDAAFPVRAAQAAIARPPRVDRVRAAVMAKPAGSITRPTMRGEGIMPPPPYREHASLAMLGIVQFGKEEVFGAPPGAIPRAPPVPVAIPAGAQPSRWSASAWFVTRRGASASGPMLGGDQAGVRLAYAPGSNRRLALYARASAPLGGGGQELAAGIEWRPMALPMRVVIEQRIGVNGAQGGIAVGVVGGVDAVMLPQDLRLEAYGQAGAVVRRRIDPFADGALRVTRTLAGQGNARLDIGAGAWGAAQREAARLDIGPSAVASVPVGGQAVRVALDWRERVAGDARPGSGPALTVGADF